MKLVKCTLWLLIVPFLIQAQVFKHYRSGELERLVHNESTKDSIRERQIRFEQYYKDQFLRYEEIQPVLLPIVFNIISTPSKTVSLSQITFQLNALNTAFSNGVRMPEDDYYKDYAVDTEIQFCIPALNDTFVRRIELPNGSKYADFVSMKRDSTGIVPYQPNAYINVWVADLDLVWPPNFQAFHEAGFAQLPLRDSLTDGVVIDIDLFGEQANSDMYQKGYTLVHLIATYLGLTPLDGFGDCGGDNVDDTPHHAGPSYICFPQTEMNMASSGCPFNERLMTKNFMDNIPDDCAAMFSYGQKTRMHGNLGLQGPRRSLLDTPIIDCNTGKTSSVFEPVETSNVFKIFPNPTSQRLTIVYEGLLSEDRPVMYTIYNMTGQAMTTRVLLQNQEIDVSTWPKGIYYLTARPTVAVLSKTFEVVR